MKAHIVKAPIVKARVVLSIALAVVLLFSACPAFRPDASTEPAGSSGGLTLNMRGIAPWLLAAMDSLSAPDPSVAPPVQGRAFLYAGKVRIVLERPDGSGGWVNVIAPVEQAVSLDNSSSGSGSTTLGVTGIPAGTGYRLSLYLYNTTVSNTVPVAGAVDTVDILPGQDTMASLVCTPLSATAIIPGAGPWNQAMLAGGEKWYLVSGLAGDIIILTQSTAATPSFLFDGTGIYQATLQTGVDYEISLTEDASFFIGVAAVSAGTSSLNARLGMRNEGRIDAPVALTLNLEHAFSVGPKERADETSWYSFTVASSGRYWLDRLGNPDLEVSLYSDAAFSVPVSIETDGFGADFGTLTAGTYYLKVTNLGLTAEFTGIVADAAYAAGHSVSQGAPAAPITLPNGAAHSASVGHAIWDYRSYYKFTTGSFLSERIEISGMTPSDGAVYLDIFSSDNYSSGFLQSFQATNGSFDIVLSPTTTYYLLAGNPDGAMTNTAISFSIKCMAQDVPEPTPLSLSTPVTGTLAADPQYWEISGLTAGRRYRIWWDSATDGSGAYTGECSVSVYRPDFTGYYFLDDQAGGYSGGRMVTIATGQSGLVIKVARVNASTGTFKFQVTGENEGSLACPIILTPGVAHDFPTGRLARDDDTSWYKFTLPSSGQAWFDFFQPLDGIVTTLYSDPAYSTQLATTMAVNGLDLGIRAAGTYYLKVKHSYYDHPVESLSFNGRIVDGAWAASHSQNQGSVASPVILSDGIAKSGTVGCAIYDRNSYYRFTTDYTGRMLIDFEDASLGYSALAVYLYSGSDFTSGKWGRVGLDSNGDYSIILQPDTSYYLKVVNNSNVSACAYSLKVSSVSDPAPIPVPIAMGSPYNGMLTEAPQYFRLSGLTAGSGYRINVYCDDQVRVTAYKQGWSGIYYSNWGAGDAFVFVPEGQSNLILEITQVNGPWNFSISVYNYSPSTMYLRGTMNDWGNSLPATSMTKSIVNGDTIWTCTYALAAASSHQFKFEKTGTSSWAENWGAGEGNETVYGAGNINYNATVAGTYTFTFNMSDMVWSVSPP